MAEVKMELELYVTEGPEVGKRFSVGSGGARLGRASASDIAIADEELSRNHCLFELGADGMLSVTDLASANGTYVNGTALAADPVKLKVGDRVQAGASELVVVKVGEKPSAPAAASVPAIAPGGSIDLGLGSGTSNASGGEASGEGGRRRSAKANLLWVVAAASIVAAAVTVLCMKGDPEAEAAKTMIRPAETKPQLKEMHYEKVDANANGILRFDMTLGGDGTMRVSMDDVPGENRHVVKSQLLDEKAMARLGEILSASALEALDSDYSGVDQDPHELKSFLLTVVYDRSVKTVCIANAEEPEAFRAVREKLEAFSKNQLGIWALQYSREQLIELAEKSCELGNSKWEEREVEFGNLAASIRAYEEALFYLETVNPKPDCHAACKEGRDRSKKELDRRYREQRFQADRAINMQDWETAKRELGVLREMVPDRDDDRNREATTKLVDVEKRMKKGGRK